MRPSAREYCTSPSWSGCLPPLLIERLSRPRGCTCLIRKSVTLVRRNPHGHNSSTARAWLSSCTITPGAFIQNQINNPLLPMSRYPISSTRARSSRRVTRSRMKRTKTPAMINHGAYGLICAACDGSITFLVLFQIVPTVLTKVYLPQPLFLPRSEEHTSELQSQSNLVCRLLLEKKKIY